MKPPELNTSEIPLPSEPTTRQQMELSQQQAQSRLQQLKENQSRLQEWIQTNHLKISLSQQGIIKITPTIEPTQLSMESIPIQYSMPEPEHIISGPDYSKAKPPPNQIPFAQFSSFCDSIFRPLTEYDVLFLQEEVNARFIIIS